MADFDSSLPVRTEADGADERLHVKIVDGTTPSQRATVDTDGNVHVEIHGNDPGGTDRVVLTSEEGHTAINGIYNVTTNSDPSNFGIIGHTRNASLADAQQVERITAASPASSIVDPADVNAMDVNGFNMIYDSANDEWERQEGSGGSANVNITGSDVAFNADLDGVYVAVTNTDPDNVGLIAHVRDAAPDDTHQTQRLTSVTNSTVRALDVSLHDDAGAAYSSLNPVPVAVFGQPGDEIHDHKVAAAVAKNATDNHDYTVTAAKTLSLCSAEASGSGKIKAELQIETGVGAGTYNTIMTKFNSTANPNISFELCKEISVAAGVKVRVAITNRDNQPQDLYSTIIGTED